MKKSPKELQNDETEADIPKKGYISPEERLNYWWIKVSITI